MIHSGDGESVITEGLRTALARLRQRSTPPGSQTSPLHEPASPAPKVRPTAKYLIVTFPQLQSNFVRATEILSAAVFRGIEPNSVRVKGPLLRQRDILVSPRWQNSFPPFLRLFAVGIGTTRKMISNKPTVENAAHYFLN